ncbi:zinc-ribbon domain-containing protein [Candidatus Woesearchaeota archaeon]|nr:zinc-ribbon domain-containing protein [Candidatus Woesearchaeota archaeon]
MNKQDKQFLMILGGLALLSWLLKKEQYKCPRCNYPVTKENTYCPNCGQPLYWEGAK